MCKCRHLIYFKEYGPIPTVLTILQIILRTKFTPMKKSTLYLIGSILSLLVFVGYLGESGPKTLLGLELNIWVIRAVWLGLALLYKGCIFIFGNTPIIFVLHCSPIHDILKLIHHDKLLGIASLCRLYTYIIQEKVIV